MHFIGWSLDLRVYMAHNNLLCKHDTYMYMKATARQMHTPKAASDFQRKKA